MLDKNTIYNKTKKYFKKDTLKLFLEQIDNFYEINKIKELPTKKYVVGDELILDTNSLIHGTKISIEELKLIKENGLIAPEFINDYNKNKKKPFVVEFWKIDKEISLKEFIDKNCGVTIQVKANNGDILNNITTSITNIENEILKLEDYRDYIIYQNQEQRFMPNKYNKNSTMAFIINNNSELKNTIIKNDIFDQNFNKRVLKKILPKWFYKKYMITRNFDNYETGREKAIIFGIPSCFIEGIIVNKDYETKENLTKIKELFPNCYICNINGKIIF